jgi:hypothetical protein
LEADTRADGSYELTVPAPGRYRVRIQPLGDAGRGGTPRPDDVVVPDTPAFRHDILVPDWSVTGRVIARDTQRPLERASVAARLSSGEPGGAGTVTDADGVFRIALEAGTYILRAQAPKYAGPEVSLVAGGPAVERAFALEPGASITGRVANAGGTPRHGVLVVALVDGRVVRTGRSDADGSFTIDGLEGGTHLVFAADPDRPDFGLVTGVLPGPESLSIAMAAGSTVRVTFQSPGGAPLAGTDVRLDLVALGGAPLGVEGRSAMSQTLKTDANGVAEYRLPAGAADLIAAVQQPRLRGELRVSVPVDAPASATVTLAPRR